MWIDKVYQKCYYSEYEHHSTTEEYQMFGTDGNTAITFIIIAAAMVAAAVSVFSLTSVGSRKVPITANIIGFVLVTVGLVLTLHFWDLDISRLGLTAFGLCVLVYVVLSLVFWSLFPNREERYRRETLAKLGITGN